MLFYVIYGCTLVALIIFCFAEDIPPGTFNTVIVKHKCLHVVLSVIHISLELFYGISELCAPYYLVL